jgi:hypothetical protein
LGVEHRGAVTVWRGAVVPGQIPSDGRGHGLEHQAVTLSHLLVAQQAADLFQQALPATSQTTGVNGIVTLALKAYDQMLSEGQDSWRAALWMTRTAGGGISRLQACCTGDIPHGRQLRVDLLR